MWQLRQPYPGQVRLVFVIVLLLVPPSASRASASTPVEFLSWHRSRNRLTGQKLATWGLLREECMLSPFLCRCLPGDFSGLQTFLNCSVALWESHGLPPTHPAQWSYGQCPDVDECRLGLANCHPFASCKNTPDSFECHCNRGYAGDGVAFCNQT